MVCVKITGKEIKGAVFRFEGWRDPLRLPFYGFETGEGFQRYLKRRRAGIPVDEDLVLQVIRHRPVRGAVFRLSVWDRPLYAPAYMHWCKTQIYQAMAIPKEFLNG